MTSGDQWLDVGRSIRSRGADGRPVDPSDAGGGARVHDCFLIVIVVRTSLSCQFWRITGASFCYREQPNTPVQSCSFIETSCFSCSPRFISVLRGTKTFLQSSLLMILQSPIVRPIKSGINTAQSILDIAKIPPPNSLIPSFDEALFY